MSLGKKQKILMPEYLQKFSCIGPKCEDTCCSGWTVALDKKTYKKYKKNDNSQLKPTFNKTIIRNRNNPSDYNYATIKMNEEGACPFLSDSKLCKIHSQVGVEFLSNTCYFYPQTANKIDNVIELCASISCPEITRLALLDPEPMGFVEVEVNMKRLHKLSFHLEDTNSLNQEKDPMHYFWMLRVFAITLLQDRRYSLDERFLLLGIVLKKITKLQETNQLKQLPQFLEEYQNQFDMVEEIKSMINASDNNIRAPFSKNFIEQFSNIDILVNFANERYLQCVDDIISGLKISEKDIDEVQELYMKAYTNYYQPYMEEKEYILENFIVNEVFKELYPFAKLQSIEDSYIMLLTLYNTVKFHLIGISSQHKKLTDEIVIKMIQSFSRVILHHRNYLNIFKVETN